MSGLTRITLAECVRRCVRAVPILFLTVMTIAAGVREAASGVIFVTTTEQKIKDRTESVGCSLQEAIFSANFDQAVAIASYATDGSPRFVNTHCQPGSGDDVIVLPTRAIFYLNKIVDDADNFMGPSATPMIATTITIDANGATLARQKHSNFSTPIPNFRLFSVGPTGHLTIRRAYILGFQVQGGRGGLVAGGGMGAGGAIYVQGGALVVESSTFDGNSAFGGNGGRTSDPDYPSNPNDGGGGGGGLGGDGGNGACGNTSQTLNMGSGGGGGGSRGSGGSGSCGTGGGGGTVSNGRTGTGQPGFACGGHGGGFPDGDGDIDGENGRCAGGGGGGGWRSRTTFSSGTGGGGAYGGGGGGGAGGGGDGGHGGFGGGGGAGFAGVFDSGDGGNGGFGGGGGGNSPGDVSFGGNPGNAGPFSGSGSQHGGGGGAGLGGAIFNDSGSIAIRNSTFTRNSAVGGIGGDPRRSTANGTGSGGAIFSRNGSLTVLNSTISANQSSSLRSGGIEVFQDADNIQEAQNAPTTFVLRNTILASNSGNDCLFFAIVLFGDFGGNLIQNTFNCPGVVPGLAGADPLLGPLQYNQGMTPTMAIAATSPARNMADPASSLAIDQRGQERPAGGTGFDIGAYELCLQGFGQLQQECIINSAPTTGVPLTIEVSPPEGGTTEPAPGTRNVSLNSVYPLKALPNPGWAFAGWSPNVTNPTSATTTVTVTGPTTVTASFVLCDCAVDVTEAVSVSRGPYVFNPITRRYAQSVTITNVSASTVAAPISLVLDNLTSTATLFNATGVTQFLLPAGSPYVNSGMSLAPGQSLSIALQFTAASTGAIGYSTRVLAGPGSR